MVFGSSSKELSQSNGINVSVKSNYEIICEKSIVFTKLAIFFEVITLGIQADAE